MQCFRHMRRTIRVEEILKVESPRLQKVYVAVINALIAATDQQLAFTGKSNPNDASPRPGK